MVEVHLPFFTLSEVRNVPDQFAGPLAAGKDQARALLEAYALEGHRAGRLSEYHGRAMIEGFKHKGFRNLFEEDDGRL